MATVTSSTSTVIADVACTACACVCDDLTVTLEQGRITGISTECPFAVRWFDEHAAYDGPVATVAGEPVELSRGLDAAAEILRHARSPLIYGLSRSSTPGQRAAVALADLLRATIDTTASEGHAPSILALQQVGESTASLGEIRNRADLVIYWGSDPATSHPRHLERYSLYPVGHEVPRGRADRTLVVVDPDETETAKLADVHVRVERGRDFEAIWTLRGLLRGIEPFPDACVGANLEQLRELATRMRSCRSGVVFFGYGLARQPVGNRNVEALLKLVTELNQHTRFYARRMRVLGDVSGADNVLGWQTGYPFSVNFSRSYPRYNPTEYSAGDMLANAAADAVLLIGTDRVETFSAAALEHLRRVPVIVLERPRVALPVKPAVALTTGVYGIHFPGTAYRMDEVPIPLRSLLPTHLPTDAELLLQIHARLSSQEQPQEG